MTWHLPTRATLTASAALVLAACATLATSQLHAAEHITLRNGFELDCLRRETSGTQTRLYLIPSRGAPSPSGGADSLIGNPDSYMEIASSAILRIEPFTLPAPPPVPIPPAPPAASATPHAPSPTPSAPNIQELLSTAGTRHNIDADLLASVVHAESAGRVRVVSHAGARGLMQLMPHTAADLGVHDSFAPDQNIAGGSAYLDILLTRYHDDVTLALAAYNAGPAAVDRFHGIPPYAETRAYVARVLREFNRRKQAVLAAK